MNEIPDYGDDAAPSNAELVEVSATIRALQRAEEALEDAEQEARLKKQTRDDLAKHRLPELLLRLGYEPGDKIRMAGVNLELRADVTTKIPVARRAEAFAWLEERGHSGLIKSTVVVGFRRDEHDRAQSLVDDLSDYENVKQEEKVESSTLKKFVRDRLAAGEEVPRDLFGVFEFKEVRLKNK